MALLIGAALVIGVLLGLLGGGGSILTVPALVYLAGLAPKDAIVTSLIVVSITSVIAVVNYASRKRVCWKTGITFGVAGMAGAYSGGRLAAFIPGPVLLVLFAAVMMLASVAMLRGGRGQADLQEACRDDFCPLTIPVAAILFDGILVGLITGLIGVGGGFLLVPALSLLAGLPIQAAIGTSLFIIVLQSIAALAGHAEHLSIDFQLTGLFTVFAVAGSLVGSHLGQRIDGRLLKPFFGVFVFILGCFLLYQEMSSELITQIRQLLDQYREFLQGALSIVVTLLLYRLWSWLHWRKAS